MKKYLCRTRDQDIACTNLPSHLYTYVMDTCKFSSDSDAPVVFRCINQEKVPLFYPLSMPVQGVDDAGRTIQGFPKRGASEPRGPYKLRYIFNIYVVVLYYMCIFLFLFYIYVVASGSGRFASLFYPGGGIPKFRGRITPIYL